MNKFPAVPAYSFPRTHKPEASDPRPGPGAYFPNINALTCFRSSDQGVSRPVSTIKFSEKKIASNSIGHKGGGVGQHSSRVGAEKGLTPGPGAYHPSPKAYLAREPAFHFSRSRRDNSSVEGGEMVGPSYYMPKFVGLKKEFFATFGKAVKNGLANSLNLPGPGQYDGDKLKLTRSPAAVFPKAKAARKENEVPGPGAYDFFEEKKHGYKFPMTSKEGTNRQSGPGFYEIPSTIPDVAKYNYPDQQHRKIKI